MSTKRRNTSSPEPDDSPVSKRQKLPLAEEDSDDGFDHPCGSELPRIDPTYGQKAAFPGLGDDADELSYSPPSDGLEYLRMVRSEAKGVPHLLVAPRTLSQYHHLAGNGVHLNGRGEQEGGYYADGAYTAVPDTHFQSSPNGHSADAQDLYYDSLSARFKLLHATLKCNPPLSAVEALGSATLISLPPDTEVARSQWRYHLQSSDPLTVQLACMDSESVLEVVKVLTAMMSQIIRSRSRDRVLRFGAWAWGVLGRCRDRNELGSEEIAVLRELGKRAVRILVGIRDKTGQDHGVSQEGAESENEDPQQSIMPDEAVAESVLHECREVYDVSMHTEELDPSGPTSDEQDTTALEAAKRRLQGALLSVDYIEIPSTGSVTGGHNDAPGVDPAADKLDVDRQIRVTLDMIVTIVGEFYGQRDLLEFRDIWGNV